MNVVYTSICGGRDPLRDDQCTDGADFVAFMDVQAPSLCWRIVPACDRFHSPLFNAKAAKVQPHQWIQTDYSLWIDGTIALKTPMQILIDTFLADADLAVFSHPERKCIFSERFASMGRYDHEEIKQQIFAYAQSGWPKDAGLYECGILLRRHTKSVELFNDLWWSEICRWSPQDQLSMPIAVERSGVKLRVISGSIRNNNNPYFHYRPRAEYESLRLRHLQG